MLRISLVNWAPQSLVANQLRDMKHVHESVRIFLNGDHAKGLAQAFFNYKNEFTRIGPQDVLTMPVWEEKKKRPHKEILTLMMQSLGPLNPLTIETQAKLKGEHDNLPHTPMQPRYLERRRGGLPRRLLNGKWMWEGSHWSIKNKNKMGSGHESNMFDRVGVF